MSHAYRAVFAVMFATSACAGGMPPVEMATERVARSVERSEGASRNGSYALPVRYNPARCECPDYEILVRGGWTRAFVDGAPTILEQLGAGTSLQTVSLQGRVANERRAGTDRVLYPVFVTATPK